MTLLSRRTRVHFFTAYLEYLYDQGIKSEYYYVGDASRFIRHLIARCGPEEIESFLAKANSPSYRARLEKTLRKFYRFANDRLDMNHDPFH